MSHQLTCEAAACRPSDRQASLSLFIFPLKSEQNGAQRHQKETFAWLTSLHSSTPLTCPDCLPISAAPGCVLQQSPLFVVPLIENNMERCCRPERLLVAVKHTILLTLAHSLLGSQSPGRRLVVQFHDTMQLSWQQILLIIFLFKCRAGQRACSKFWDFLINKRAVLYKTMYMRIEISQKLSFWAGEFLRF